MNPWRRVAFAAAPRGSFRHWSVAQMPRIVPDSSNRLGGTPPSLGHERSPAPKTVENCMREHRGKLSSQRPLRVGEEIRHALARILARGTLRDPELQNLSITVTEVRMSPDLRHATAFVIPLGGDEVDRTVKALGRAAPYLRGQIAKLVQLRFVPELDFKADTTFEYADRIEGLLRRPAIARDPDGGEDGGHNRGQGHGA